MALRYPFLIIVGLLFIIFCIFFKKKKLPYKKGIKVANTSFIKEHPYYKNKLRVYKFLLLISKILCLIAIFVSFILLARPYKTQVINDTEYNRDIFLCMDVSASVNSLNSQLVDNLKETVNSLKGERFGISIFNTSSVTLVPLTEDYEYVTSVLDQIKKSIEYSSNSGTYNNEDDYLTVISYIYSGTNLGSEERGSSLIGDGLASCVYNFSKKDEDRTKIIIFSTDNSLAGTPLITLEQAAQISKRENVIVYGLGSETISRKDKDEYQKAVEITNGKYYDSKESSVKSIVDDIEKTSKSVRKKENEIRETDTPLIPFIVLLISIFTLIIVNKKVIS